MIFMYPQKVISKKTARACLRNRKISAKDSGEIARLIRGKNVEKARNYLKDVLLKKKAIPYRRYTDKVAHRKGIGPGKYPINATKEIIELLNNAESNAEDKGLDTKKLFIKHMSSTKGRQFQRPRRFRYRGQKAKSANVSIVVEER